MFVNSSCYSGAHTADSIEVNKNTYVDIFETQLLTWYLFPVLQLRIYEFVIDRRSYTHNLSS